MFNQSLRIVRVSSALLLSLALGACMSARPPLGLPDASVVSFNGEQAVPPDCRSIAIPSHLRDPDMLTQPSIPFGCATYSNLAAQLARPADIASPLPFAGADGVAAERSVQRYDNPPAQHGQSQDNGNTPTPITGVNQ
jgi:pilus assembly protein CpaD